jgi:penicillin-binding protein 1B
VSRRRRPRGGSRVLGVLFWLSIPLAVAAIFGLGILSDQIISKFEGKRWTLPAKVYARPLELYAGQSIAREQIEWELREIAYRPATTQKLGPGEFRWKGSELTLRTRGFEFWDAAEPEQDVRLTVGSGLVQSLSVDGDETAVARLEPKMIGGIYPSHNEDRILVSLADVPQPLIDALIATEDRDFYQHVGLSPRGIARAILANLGGKRQGASTLTQQLVKNFYLTSERTLRRKATEAVMALLLERHASKDQILEAYLNEVYLGQAGERGIHGMGLASLYYFGQPLKDLGIEQMALMVGILRGPSQYDPRRHPARATERRNQVLLMMEETGKLPREKRLALAARPLGVTAKPLYEDNRYPGFMTLVQRNLKQEYADEDLRSEGLRIFSTLDPWVQEQLERALQSRISALQKTFSRAPVLEGAGVITLPASGEIVALQGGKDARFQGFNRATDTARAIGSLVKPAVYLTAIEKGYRLSQRIPDEPFTLALPSGDWSPGNYDGKSHGDVTLLEALSNSYNLATAKLALDIGVSDVAEVVRRMGVSKNVPEVPSLSLGVLELAPIEVAGMYQTVAAGGFNSPLRVVRSVLDGDGKPLQRYAMDVDKRFEAADTYLLTRAMQQTFISGTARGVAARFPGISPAGKTGTTNDQRDSWFVGFTGNYLGVVWVGNDENKSTPLTGASGALSVWSELFSKLSLEPLSPVQPEEIRWDYFNTRHDTLSQEGCPEALYLPARVDTLPSTRLECGAEPAPPDWVDELFGTPSGDATAPLPE